MLEGYNIDERDLFKRCHGGLEDYNTQVRRDERGLFKDLMGDYDTGEI